MKVNGSLLFDASSASEIQNLRIQKVSANPTFGTADIGRLIYNTTSGIIYVGIGSPISNWVAIATGGDAAALQAEVDAIEAALGVGVGSNGVFNAAGFTNTAALTNPTSFTNAIQQIANYATANDTLAELDDVTLGTLTAGQFLRYDAGTSKWVNHTLVLANVTDVTVPVAQLNLLNGLTATAAELNILDGVTGTTTADISSIAGYAAEGVSATEFGYLDGVTSDIQTQLDNKQPLDATLTALAAMAAPNGIVVQTATDTFTKRTLVAPAAGLTITDADGVAGNPTFVLANDLAALEGLATTGYIVRTGDGTATTRLFTGQAGRIVVTNGDGVASNTDIDLATVTDGGTGSFLKFTRDTYGRVSGTTPVVLADITALANGTYVNVAGDTMTGNLIMGTGTYITLNETPVAGTDAANKAYVDAATQGLSWKQAVVAASTGNLTLSGAQTVDGVALVAGDRVLVKNQTTTSENGIYVVAAGAWTRAIDMNQAAEFDGSAVFVQQGTVNEGTGWTETLTVTTVDTSPVAFSQFSGGQAFIWGTGLANTGNTVFVNLGAGISELPSDEIGLDIEANKAIQLTNGTASGQLTLVLASGSGLAQSSAGLTINTASVTNAMLVNQGVGLNADSGTGTLNLGQTLLVAGTSTQGIVTSASGQTITITASNASASQKGVASFDANDFTVTAGNVVIATGGVDNAQLANSTITVAGTTGSDAVALGETLTFSSTVSGLVSSTVATNGVALDVRLATATLTGVASFNADHFSVTAGAVDLAATLDDLTNVSSADAATTGDVLSKTAGDWQPVSRAALVGSTSVADHNDVTVTSPSNGQQLVYVGGQWVNRKTYHLETVTVAATSWTVTHNIGQKYCNVTIVDDTDEVVIPQSITFTNANTVTVTFNTAVAGYAVVMGVNAA